MAQNNPYDDLVRDDAVQGAVNPYMELATENNGAGTTTPARLSMMNVAGRNPDVEARLQNLAKTYGVPTDTIRLDERAYNDRAIVDSIDYTDLARNYPTTAGLVADPSKAAIAYDDTSNLSAIEKGVRFLANSGRALVSAIPATNEGAWGVLQAAVDTAGNFLEPLNGTVLPENPLARASAAIASMRKIQGGYKESWMPKADGIMGSGYYSGLQSLGQMGLSLPFALAGPEAMLAVMSGSQGGQSYGQARDKGLPVGQSLSFATSQAAIEYATEKIPVARFLHDVKAGTPFYSMLARQITAEVPGEQVATVLQDLNEWAILNPEKPFSSYLAERPSAAAQTLIATIVAAGGATTAGRATSLGMERINRRSQDAETGVAGGQVIEALNAAAVQSRLRERSPQQFQEFVAKAAEDGPVQDVYIDASQLAQSGVDLAQLAQASPSVAAQYAEASATGGMVRIPVDEFATHIAGTDAAAAMMPHLKTDPAGMSMAEGEAFLRDRGAALDTEVRQLLEERAPTDAFRASRQAVQEEFLQKLNDANRFTPDVNESYANLMANFYAVQAARLGITPQEMAARYPVDVRATLEAPRQLDQSEAPKNGTDYFAPEAVKAAQESGRLVNMSPETFLALAQPEAPEKDKVSGVRKVTSEGGQFSDLPSLTVRTNSDGTTQVDVHDGRHRVRELRRLGVTSVPVLLEGDAVGDALRGQGDHRDNVVRPENFGDVPEGRNDNLRDLPVEQPPAQQPPRQWTDKEKQEIDDLLAALGPDFNQADTAGKRGGYSGVYIEGQDRAPSAITLLETADLSTALHEFGHFYLEVLTDVARQQGAPQEIRNDVQTVLDWFGVKDQSTWDAMTLEQKRESHEKFARGFESYLFEGKSPNVELQGIFSRFRAWLLNIYRNALALNVNVSDDIRGVFDRMLATSDAIAEAQSVAGMTPLFKSAEAAGMTPDEWRAYQSLGVEAQQDAQENLERRSLRDMKWLSRARNRVLKEMQVDADSKRATVRDEVSGEVYATPLYGAMDFLKRGRTTVNGEAVNVEDSTTPHKLSIDALTEMYGHETDKFALLDWSKLGYGKYGMLAKDGLHPDVVAQMFGYTSGDQLVHALLDAEPVNSVIDGMTDQRMLERYGDLSDPRAMAQAADAAVHNEARAKFVAAELNALAKATGRPKVLADAARAYAQQVIARQRVRDLRPSQYSTAEAKAARAAQEALARGDLAEAAVQKRNQLINNYAARAALAAQNEVTRDVAYLKKFDAEGVRRNIDLAYQEQIDALLERYDLRTGQSLKAIDRRKSLLEWVQSQEEQGLTPVIDPELLNEANRKSYKDMSLEELRGLTDAVRNIEHLGRLKQKLLTAQDKRDFAEVVDAVSGSILDHATRTVPERRSSDRGLLVSPSALFRNFVADHRKFASVVRQFDGWKDGGPAWEYLVRNMNRAGDFEAVNNEKATIRLGEILAPLLSERGLGKKAYFPDIGKSFTLEERIGMALNVGNEINRERVLSGEHLSPQQLQTILDTLTKEHWDVVQKVWDYLETFRPAIAEKERRLTGVEPQWVEPSAVQTPFGEYKGGYYPIKYDALRSTRSEADTTAQVARQLEQGLYTRAMTRRGHLKERSESTGRPLRYDLSVLGEHVQQVVHDLAWHEYLVDANRLLKASAIDDAVRTHYGPETLRNMRELLTDIAVGGVAAQTSLDRLMNHLRTGATITGLGFRFTTALLQPLGLTQSMVRIGPKWVAKGVAHWGAGVLGIEKGTKEMFEMSDFMRLRGKTMQREINEIQNRVRGMENSSPFSLGGVVARVSPEMAQKVTASYFYMIAKLQLVADVPTWWGMYEKAMSQEGMTEDKAIALADQAVRDAQGHGQIGDLAAIQRGGSGQKLFTSFYSFFNVTYNLTAEVLGRTDFKKPRDVAMLVCDLALLYVIPSIASTLMKSALHGGDDKDKLLRAMLADQLNYVFGTMVGLREVGAAVQAISGEGGSDYSGPASVRFFADLAKFSKQAGQGEADEAFWKSLNSVSGVLFHYPAGQINATVSGINALADGKTQNPGALLVGAPPKK